MRNLRKNSILYNIYKTAQYTLIKRHVYGLTSPIRVLPDFIVIGVVRGGTTSLYQYLGEHPCIARSAYDELGFFDSNYHLGLNWYRSLFPTIFTKNRIMAKRKHFMTYDVTPFYIYNPNVVQRVRDTLPDVKIIAVLRNPADRAYSNYHLAVRSGNEKRTFEEVVKEDIAEIDKAKTRNLSKEEYFGSIVEKSYIARGFYAEQLQMWLELFPKEQLLVISTEELASKTNETLSTIFDFLKLPRYEIKNLTKRNEAKYPPMNPNTRKLLVDYFRPHNEQLSNLFGEKYDWNK